MKQVERFEFKEGDLVLADKRIGLIPTIIMEYGNPKHDIKWLEKPCGSASILTRVYRWEEKRQMYVEVARRSNDNRYWYILDD